MKNPSSNRIDSASRMIAATPKTIYDAFMNPISLRSWLPPEGMSAQIDQFDACIGGTYRMTLKYDNAQSTSGKTTDQTDETLGTFLNLVPNTKIVLTVEFNAEDPVFSGEMIQNWYLEAVSLGTKVSIICEHVPEGIRKEDHINGLSSTLENLAHFVEQ